jgi:hypothetical protein
MIGARGTDGDGGTLLVLGLLPENLTRLQAGQPIHLRHETHPFIPEGWTVVIASGSVEELAHQLKQPNTVVRAYGPATTKE